MNKARGEDTFDPNSTGIDVDLHRSLSLELKFRRQSRKGKGRDILGSLAILGAMLGGV